MHFKEKGVLIWSTSDHFIKKAVSGANMGPMSKIDMSFNEGIELDLYRNKMYRFPLERGHFRHGRVR
jgi:hypothetical protein